MIISASDQRNDVERTRLIDEARRISLNGLRDIGKAFSSSLNLPFLLLFGAGIMIPMVLMSVLPMLSVGGLFGSATISPAALAVITLVLIPAALMATVMTIRERNPFRKPFDTAVDPLALALLACTVPIIFALTSSGMETARSLCIG